MSRYISNGSVKQDGVCLVPQQHYRVVQSSSNRTDNYQLNASPAGNYAAQQQNPAGNNQSPSLRGIPPPQQPTGLPNQSSTPPSELKVHQVSQQSLPQMLFHPAQGSVPRSNYYTRGSSGPNPATRMPAHQQRSQQVYAQPQQFGAVALQTIVPNPYYRQQPPQSAYVSPYMLNQYYPPSQGHPQIIQYFSPFGIQRTSGHPGQAAAASLTPPQPMVPNMIASQQIPQPQQPYQRQKRPRPNAIAIIDPATGKDKLKDMFETTDNVNNNNNTNNNNSSHPPSGESSTCPTPQPSSIPVTLAQQNREIQAAFSKQAVQSIHGDEMNADSAADHIEPPPVQHSSNMVVHQTGVMHTPQQHQGPPPPPPSTHHMPPQLHTVQAGNEHMAENAIYIHQHNLPPQHHHLTQPPQMHNSQPHHGYAAQPVFTTQSNRLDHIVQSSNLKVQAKEFISVVNPPPPNTNMAATSTTSSVIDKETTPVVSANCDSVEVTIPKKEASPLKVRKQMKEQKEQQQQQKEVTTTITTTAPSIVSTAITKDSSSSTQTPITSDVPNKDKDTAKKDEKPISVVPTKDDRKRNKENKTSSAVDSHMTGAPEAGPVITVQDQQQQSAKPKSVASAQKSSKQDINKNQVSTGNQMKQPSTQVYSVPQTQPPKSSSKTHRKHELNQKGLNKEGTDMDAINDVDIIVEKTDKIKTETPSTTTPTTTTTTAISSSTTTTAVTATTTINSVSAKPIDNTENVQPIDPAAIPSQKSAAIPPTTCEQMNITNKDAKVPPLSNIPVASTTSTIIPTETTTVTTTSPSASSTTPIITTATSFSRPAEHSSMIKTLPKNKIDVTDIVKEKPKELKPYISPQAPSPPIVETSTKDSADGINEMVASRNEINVNSASNSTESPPASNVSKSSDQLYLPYNEGQWSPQNQSGKKVYDKEFLMALKNFPNSRKMPEGTILNFLLADRQRSADGRYTSSGRNDSFTYNTNYGGKSGSQQRLSAPKNSKPVLGKISKSQIIKVSISVKDDVKLNEVENAWRPARALKDEGLSDDIKKTLDISKRVRGILNKLTPQKFAALVQQLKALSFDSEERLDNLIGLVFEKALEEPKFSKMYASLCKELSSIEISTSNPDAPSLQFTRLLVKRCEQQFLKNVALEEGELRKAKQKELEMCTDPEREKELEDEVEELDRKIRMRSVGNIRFIGELYNAGLLKPVIVMHCLQKLLTIHDEESLECLCKLLTTVGQSIDQGDKSDDLEFVFKEMRKIVDQKHGETSSRIRFMMLDVFDLRQNKWMPRRQDAPQTIEQIQKDAENEERLTMLALNSMPPRKDDYRGSSSIGPNSDQKQRTRNVTDDSGWTKSKNFTIRRDKLRNVELNEETLGPAKLFAWSQGSTYKSSTPTMTNMYSALAEGCNDNDRRSLGVSRSSGGKDIQGYTSKGHSMDRSSSTTNSGYHSSSMHSSYDGRRSGSRYDIQHRPNDSAAVSSSKRNHNLSTGPGFASLPHASSSSATSTVQISNSAAPPQRISPTTPTARSENIVSKEDFQNSFNMSLQEYIDDSCSVTEFLKDIDFNDDVKKYMSDVVTETYMHVLERKNKDRRKCGELFSKLIKENALSVEQYCDGLAELLKEYSDLIIDIPTLWTFIAEAILFVICDETLPLKRLQMCCEPLISDNVCHRLLKAVFEAVISEKDVHFLKRIWSNSKLALTDFMSAKDADEYSKKFDFCNTSNEQSSILSYAQIHEQIMNFIDHDKSFDEIVKWIELNVGEYVKEKKFIRALATAIFEHSIIHGTRGEAITNALQNHYKLFLKFIDRNSELELECLYALQSVIHKMEHPSGVLLSICNKLLDDSFICQESFLAWEKSEDPAEQAGKGVALKQLTAFFTHMKEAEDECSSTSEDT